jgi:hypothetical protein
VRLNSKNLLTTAVFSRTAHRAFAHLGLARAYVMQGDTAKAKTAYQDFLFLTPWKDATLIYPS